jgi:hypothetical protein
MDAEMRTLLEKFSQYHPEGAKEILKLVLKLYLKLVDKSRRKGGDPLLIFQNLVERIVTGKLYETTQDRIDHLDSLVEERQAAPDDHEYAALRQEISEIRGMLRDIRNKGPAEAPNAGDGNGLPTEEAVELQELTQRDDAGSPDADKAESGRKKRKVYR